ncbi:hypothetical protein ACLOAV_007091 [Pseudogymnoascus australis]
MDSESCFDVENNVVDSDSDTIPTDIDSDVEDNARGGDSDTTDVDTDVEDHPPEYYLHQEDDSDSDDEIEDYRDNTLCLISGIEQRFHRYCKYVEKDPIQSMQDVTPRMIGAFFDWVLNQRRGKGGRRLKGIKTESSLISYYKNFRMACEKATGIRIGEGDIVFKRMVNRKLRKLAKKHKLTREKREKAAIDVESLSMILHTNLTTTKKRYTHGRQRIAIMLFLLLAGFSGNRPQAILDLCYRHIIVSLLRNPKGGPHRILIEFTCEFTKQFLGVKEANTFVLPEIIFDPSLLLSPHVSLLGMIIDDEAFQAPNLTSGEAISKLDIRPGCNQLQLFLKPEKANIPIFRKSVRTPYGWEISPTEPLPYSTLLRWMEGLGVLSCFPQIIRPYGLRYNAGNKFNKSGDVSDALQNMMLQHADMRTFIDHYLSRRVGADTRAIVCGYEPQTHLMEAACRLLRWIDPCRPQELTSEQSQSVNQSTRVLRLVARREELKHRSGGTVTTQPHYKALTSDIARERQRQRIALLKKLRDEWDLEKSVSDIELQLSGLKFDEDLKTTLDLADDMPQPQRRLVETVITLPGTTLEEEICRRNAAINATAAYCKFQEGGAAPRRAPIKRTGSTPADPQLAAAETEKQALDAAMLSVYTEKRPKICFMCLGERNLSFEKRTKSFASPGDLTKHFKRKHLANIKKGDRIGCKVCRMSLEHKPHLRNHAESIHGTVS